MKTWIVFLILYVIACLLAGAQTVASSPAFVGVVHQQSVVTGGGGGGAAFSDNFDRADAGTLGANWTADAGSISISGNLASSQTGGYAAIAQRYTGTACSTVNQYVMISFDTCTKYPCLYVRMNAGGACYSLEFAVPGDEVTWGYKAAAGDSPTTIVASALALSASGTYGVTITGTGTSTEVRVWANPTGLPSAAGNWNGDTTPDLTFTTDPATAVDTGNYVGIGGSQDAAAANIFNNFFGGNFP